MEESGGGRGLPNFDVSGTVSQVSLRWTKWLRSFEYMVDGKGITDFGRRRALLLHLAGEDVQDIFHDLTDPDVSLPPDQRTRADNVCKQCTRILSHHFAAAPNPTHERHVFRQLTPESDKTSQQFCACLRQQARLCGFAMDFMDEAIRDQIIATIKSSELRQKLLSEVNLSLQDKLRIARTWEDAHSQAAQLVTQVN